jgi:hypothetical protein
VKLRQLGKKIFKTFLQKVMLLTTVDGHKAFSFANGGICVIRIKINYSMAYPNK